MPQQMSQHQSQPWYGRPVTNHYSTAEEAIENALAGVAALARSALDTPTLRVAVQYGTTLHTTLTTAQRSLDEALLTLTRNALLSGIDPDELVDKPYPARKLRAIARELSLPARRPGPRPRRAPAADVAQP
jgi:hypothetical protein